MIIKLVIISVALLLVLATNKESIYFDALGNSYKNNTDIVFYDKDGISYSIDKNTKYFIDNNNNFTNKCHVDKNGTVSDINENELYISSITGIDYLLNGEVYFMNTNIYWDKDNQMHFFNNNNDIIVNEYNFKIDIKTGDCSIKKFTQ